MYKSTKNVLWVVLLLAGCHTSSGDNHPNLAKQPPEAGPRTESIPASLIGASTDTIPTASNRIELCTEINFVSPAGFEASAFKNYKLPATEWTQDVKKQAQENLEKLSRILKSPLFEHLYNKQAPTILVQSESPNGYPTTYSGLVDEIEDMQSCPLNAVLLDADAGELGSDWGWIFMNKASYAGDLGLMLHEISHTWGGEHNDNHLNWPTNLPYMLQIMVNVKADNLQQAYCGGGRCDESSGLGLKHLLLK